jgi:dTMP kinase
VSGEARDMFFSFDGLDGVGKSTQMRLFCQWLEEQGREVIICRDPGSTPLGERVRSLLLDSDDATPIGVRSEMLLYMAARAQLVDEVIRPALAAGKDVASDRFLLANIVYQGYAGGMDVEAIRRVGAVAVDGVLPDCMFVLDMDPVAALARVGRNLDRMERRGQEYRQRLRAGFLAEARGLGDAVHVVDAGQGVDDVQNEIRRIAAALLRPA